MKATVKKYGSRFEIIGLDPLKIVNDLMTYEMRFLFTFSGKTYKTEQNAIKAIVKAGFEYISVADNQLVCAYD